MPLLSFEAQQSAAVPQRCSSISASIVQALAVALAAIYALFFVTNLSPYWFNPRVTTDDAVQQVAVFHEALHPGIFSGDLVQDTMRGYLAPLHYWLGFILTRLTSDPIMASHWMMLVQVLLCAVGVFFALSRGSNIIAACLGLTWLLHTRNVIQRMTGGLPRGWAAGLIALYLALLHYKKYRCILCLIFAGCLLNPVATIVVALSYGFFLSWKLFFMRASDEYRRPFLELLICSPIFLATTLFVIHRPPEVGQMVSYEQAQNMPEFDDPGGRFPFLPLKPVWNEISEFGMQAFVNRWSHPGEFFKSNICLIVLCSCLCLALLGLIRRRIAFPAEYTTFLIAILVIYLASRQLLFKLYVPNRHLQIPLGLFFITALPHALYQLFASTPNEGAKKDLRVSCSSSVALALLCCFVFLIGGSGLRGVANFNLPAPRPPNVFAWIKEHASPAARIAGQPDLMDQVPLFAMRKVYASTEVAHPFYLGYYAEIKRRLEIALKAHYAASPAELYSLLKDENIDYFVFRRKDFYPQSLREATYFKPLDRLIRTLASKEANEYLFKQLPASVNLELCPYMPYRDEISALIDIASLKSYLETHEPRSEPRQTPP